MPLPLAVDEPDPGLAPYPLLPPVVGAVPALVDRDRVVVVLPAVPDAPRAAVVRLLPVLLPMLLLLLELPTVRDGDSIAAVPPRVLVLVPAAVASWLPLVRSGPPVLDVGLARGDNDPAGGGLKPKRLTPGAVGGFTLEGVRDEACCGGGGDMDAGTGGGGGGAAPPLSAEVRGERAASVCCCCCSSGCFPAGVPGPPPAAAEPTERRTLPSHSFSLPSRETRRGLRRVPCRASNIAAMACWFGDEPRG